MPELEYYYVDGTAYHEETPRSVIGILERFRKARTAGILTSVPRLRLYYGDQRTGKDWGEVCDTTGYIGRSTGEVKIPILLHNRLSIGGTGILDHCIVKIEYANKKDGGVLYQHPTYHKTEDTPTLELALNVCRNGI
jgi:hypothetical protein